MEEVGVGDSPPPGNESTLPELSNVDSTFILDLISAPSETAGPSLVDMRPRPDEFELSGMRHRAGFLAAGDYDDGSSAALDEQGPLSASLLSCVRREPF